RAGLNPAWVSGAMTEIIAARPSPMTSGADPDDGRLGLRAWVTAQIRSASIAVPTNSARKADQGVTMRQASSAVPNTAGLGKYSPNIMADSSLPGPPRSRGAAADAGAEAQAE